MQPLIGNQGKKKITCCTRKTNNRHVKCSVIFCSSIILIFTLCVCMIIGMLTYLIRDTIFSPNQNQNQINKELNDSLNIPNTISGGILVGVLASFMKFTTTIKKKLGAAKASNVAFSAIVLPPLIYIGIIVAQRNDNAGVLNHLYFVFVAVCTFIFMGIITLVAYVYITKIIMDVDTAYLVLEKIENMGNVHQSEIGMRENLNIIKNDVQGEIMGKSVGKYCCSKLFDKDYMGDLLLHILFVICSAFLLAMSKITGESALVVTAVLTSPLMSPAIVICCNATLIIYEVITPNNLKSKQNLKW